MNRICLNMIVRNESKTIKRCLDSVKQYIDYWVICDTGSTDDTIDVIRDTLKDIPGEIYNDQWENFEINRNLALERAKKTDCDWIFLIDADQVLNCSFDIKSYLGSIKPNDNGYKIYVLQKLNQLEYYNIRLFSIKGNQNAKYVGVTHEYIDLDKNNQKIKIDPNYFHIYDYGDGGSKENKFKRDLELLSKDLIKNPNNHRTVFYLAQTYRCLQMYKESYDTYMKRYQMGGWDEEAWYAHYSAGLNMISLKYDEKQIIDHLLKSWSFRPWRNEPMVMIGSLLKQSNPKNAEYYLRFALELKNPLETGDILFVDSQFYHNYPRMYLADAYYNQKKYREAINEYLKTDFKNKPIKTYIERKIIEIQKKLGSYSIEQLEKILIGS